MMILKKAVAQPAFQLGANSPLQQQLMDAGLLQQQSDGLWRVKTREATQEGELAKTGDYIKLDSTGMPYPTEKTWFEANHDQVGEGTYLQKSIPKKAWCAEEPLCEEIRFLLEQGLLQFSPERGFRAQLWGAEQSADPDALVVLHQVDRDPDGKILAVDFYFLARQEFYSIYTQA